MTTTENMKDLWLESRTRFENQLSSFKEEDLRKKVNPKSNSIGFLLRHIGDVELLFAKNVFGDSTVKVKAQTIIDGEDLGQWTDIDELLAYVQESKDKLLNIIEQQKDEDWSETVTTKEFGTKTKVEAMARISSHTAYHAGQISLINKYGNN